uniref:Uncharacterized protein n=1 Tax=Anguilla anguilla TaxID=7936 RepID=A0A0E9W4H1_ANGAN
MKSSNGNFAIICNRTPERRNYNIIPLSYHLKGN